MEKEIVLEAPGAGLPWWEHRALKLFVKVAPRFTPPKKAFALLEEEIQKSLVIMSRVDASLHDKIVLVARPFGVEDSSRAYSLNMVLEHLIMVDMGLMKMIGALNHEKSTPFELDVAAVKAHKNSDHRRIFSIFAKKYEQVVVEATKRSTTKHYHPWFGYLDNFEWQVFIAYHHRIHRRQMQAIEKKLAKQ